MSHPNAPLTEPGRLRLARCVVEDGWPLRRAAERFQVSPTTAAAGPAVTAAGGRDGGPLRAGRIASPAARPRAGAADHQAAGQPSGWGRPGSPFGSACTPRPCTGAAPATGCRRWPHWTGPPAGRSAATSTTGPASWSTSTSRSSATSPTAAAGASAAGPRAGATTGHHDRHQRPAPGPAATATCTPPSTTTPGWPTPRSSRRAQGDRRRVLARAAAWFAAAGITVERVITDNGSCYRSRDWRRPAPHRASPTSGPAPTGRRPTARSNASTAPCSTNGPTPAPTLRSRRRAALPLAAHLQPSPRHTALGGNHPQAASASQRAGSRIAATRQLAARVLTRPW